MASVGPVLGRRTQAPGPLDEPLGLAWMTFHATHEQLGKALEQELAGRHGVGLSAYRLLRRLAEPPGDGVRVSELAGDVLLSPSRVSRVVDQLEALGHVKRHMCAADARGVTARLTCSGAALMTELDRTYLQWLRREVVGRLDARDLHALARISAKLR
jgi:DNA-binding MarR family transcriptional regulator